MKQRTFFMIVSIVGAVFALALILAPAFMDSTYGTGPSAAEMLTDRLYGSALLGISVVTWMARDLAAPGVRAVIMGNLVGGVVGFVVSLWGMLDHVMNATGWSTVVIYFLIAVGFAYFEFAAPPKKATSRRSKSR
jgi:hypothetical protein